MFAPFGEKQKVEKMLKTFQKCLRNFIRLLRDLKNLCSIANMYYFNTFFEILKMMPYLFACSDRKHIVWNF